MRTPSHRKIISAAWFAVIICGGLCACASNSAVVNADQEEVAKLNTPRIIVGFNTADIEPDNPEIIGTLNSILATNWTFVRKISGNAAVYIIRTQQTQPELLARFAELERIDFIKYVEFDQRRRIHNK